MGVTHINYKIAECDICGATKQFDPAWSMPGDWNNITDYRGMIRYKCVCPECSERIRDYIEEFKSLPSAQPEIIRCKDCKYCDRGIDEDGNPFLKCLGWVYGGTQEEDFCSHAERRTDD